MSIKTKLVVVGDGGCGKTYLLTAFAGDSFYLDFVFLFEDYLPDVKVADKTVELFLVDTSGQGDYDLLKPLAYQGTNVFLICFSVVSRVSLENVASRWWPEVKRFCPGIPVLLIGTKHDLREDDKENLQTMKKEPVTREEAEAVAKAIDAVAYIECSARTGFKVHEVFMEAAKATLLQKNKKKRISSKCVLA